MFVWVCVYMVFVVHECMSVCGGRQIVAKAQGRLVVRGLDISRACAACNLIENVVAQLLLLLLLLLVQQLLLL